MRRRDFVEKLGVGSAALAIGSLGGRPAAAAESHQHSQVEGPLAAATMTFGQWKTDPPLDRMAGSPPPANQHLAIPYMPTIKAGGSITFAISGLHQMLVYAPGTELGHIDGTQLIPSGAGFPPLVNDAANRIYRGPNPVTFFPVLDRIEVVTFAHPGTYLVVCGVLPHFLEGMHGYVRVIA